MSLKYHILHFIVKDIEKQYEKDGFPVYQENFLRQGVKEFPFPERQLFKMLVTNFSHCKNYGEGQTAAEYINGAFNGQRGFKDHENCDTCGQEGAAKKCSSCKGADYCDQICQKYHWFVHKKHCAKLKKLADAREEERKKKEKENADKKICFMKWMLPAI